MAADEPDFKEFDLTLTDRELEEFLSIMEMQQADGGAAAMELPAGSLGLQFGTDLDLGLQLQPHSDNSASPETSEDTAMEGAGEPATNAAYAHGANNNAVSGSHQQQQQPQPATPSPPSPLSPPSPQQQHQSVPAPQPQQQRQAPQPQPTQQAPSQQQQAPVKQELQETPAQFSTVLQALAANGGLAGQQLLAGLPLEQQAVVLSSLQHPFLGLSSPLAALQGLPSPGSTQQQQHTQQPLQQQQQQQQQQQHQQQQQQAELPGSLQQPPPRNRATRQQSDSAASMKDAGVSHSTVEKQRRDRLNSLIEELSDIVPATEAKYTSSSEGAAVRRPKHVVLADTISLLRHMQEKLRLEERENSILRQQQQHQQGSALQASSGTQANGGAEAVHLPVAPESAALATGVVVEQGKGSLYVKVNCRDRKGLLSDLVTALRSLPLVILTAAITTTPDGKVHDVFEVQLDDANVGAEDIHAAINAAIYAGGDRVTRGKRHRTAQTAH